MEIIQWMEKLTAILEKSSIFLAARFILGFYLIIIVVVILLILFQLYRKGYLTEVMAGSGRVNLRATKDKSQKRWDKIIQRLNSNQPNDHKAAVLEAAHFFNEILTIADYPGETLGEKLNKLEVDQFENIDQIKEANLIKNQIVQEENFVISQEEARRVVEIFGESLQFLEVIN